MFVPEDQEESSEHLRASSESCLLAARILRAIVYELGPLAVGGQLPGPAQLRASAEGREGRRRCPPTNRGRCTRPATATACAGTTRRAAGDVRLGSRQRRRRGRGSVTSSGPGCAARRLPLHRTITFEEHVDRYLAAHAVGRDPFTIRTLEHRLGYATATFGDLPLEELERRVPEIAAWVGTLPGGVAVRDRAGVPAGARGRSAVGAHDARTPRSSPGRTRSRRPRRSTRSPRRRSTRRGGARPEVRARWSCSRPRPACGRLSGSRSSGATSTARPASCSSSGRARTASRSPTGRPPGADDVCRCPRGARGARRDPAPSRRAARVPRSVAE